MVLPGLCQTALAVLRQVEPVIMLEEMGSSFFNTALQMVVNDRCANATYPDAKLSSGDSQQRAMSDFYMTYTLIIKLCPILPAVLLAKLGDRGWRRTPIVVPLCGYLVSRIILLLVVIFRFPLQVMYGAAVLFGLSGGYCAYWPGVMTVTSLGSTAAERSKVIMRVELLYGAAGLVGSMVSGHLFLLQGDRVGNGTVLLSVSVLLHVLSLLFATALLKVKQVSENRNVEENRHLKPDTDTDTDASPEAPAKINMVNVALLFTAAILYGAAVGGAVEILGIFVLKEPLSWDATQVGYGNAAGSMIFFTSFLALILFRRCCIDVSLILIGMLSFASGIFFMSFVTATYQFYLARSLTMFALIPMPTIRSLLSLQVPTSSCGTTLTFMQLSLTFTGLAYIPAFIKIYQRTLDWFPGFVFMLASVITVLGMIPISIVGCRLPKGRGGGGPHKRASRDTI